jgi:GYF domain 2
MDKEWFYVNGAGKTVGPVSGSSIRDHLRANPNWRKVHVWSEGYTDWNEAGKAPEFEELTRAAPPRPPLKATNPWRARFYGFIGLVLTIVAASFGSIIGKGAVQGVISGTATDPFSAEATSKMEADLKKTLPRKIDDVTQLVDVKLDRRNWTYTSQIDSAITSVPSTTFNELRMNNTATVCKDSNTVRGLKAGLVMNYIFKNKTGANLGTYSIRDGDCPKG